MTASELLALLGRAWFQLLIYPGGLAAFGLVVLTARFEATVSSAGQSVSLPAPLALSAVVLPWLGLALLPVPGTSPLLRPLDAVGVLALLEWPRLLAVAAELRSRDRVIWERGARRLAAALNSYPPLLLALLLLAVASGTVQLDRLARLPADRPQAALPHWLGAGALVAALPPLLGLGPFAARGALQAQSEHRIDGMDRRNRLLAAGRLLLDAPLAAGLRLRAVGLSAFAALPLFAALDNLPPWLLPLPALLLALLLWLYQRRAGGAARRWAGGYLLLDGLLLLALLWSAGQALVARLS